MSVETMRDQEASELASMSLDELAERANTEYRLANEAAASAVEHAIRCGEALLVLYRRDSLSDWPSWAERHLDIQKRTAYRWMRLAHHRDKLPQTNELRGVVHALESIADQPGINGQAARRSSDWLAEEARRLHAEGCSVSSISERFGVSPDHVRRWVLWRKWDAERKAKAARRKAAAKALREQERQRERAAAAKAAGGGLAKAYSRIRQTLADLQVALDEANPGEEREAVRAAMSAAHKAEDQIVAASKLRRAG